MRDIPFFQTENGVASLILHEVAYKQIAYVQIQSFMQFESLLQECVDFCRAVGAEKVYATGSDLLNTYPLFTSIIEMRCLRDKIPCSSCNLVPVTKGLLEKWREIYNERMRNVPNAATITSQEADTQINAGAYFVYHDNVPVGIGKVSGNQIDAVAAVVAGMGREVVSALCTVITGEVVCVEVATANSPAIRLYEAMGFVETKEISAWYCVC